MLEKQLAAKILEKAVSFDGEIGKLYSLNRENKDKPSYEIFENSINLIMGIIAKGIIFPIIDQYPELDPDNDK